MLTKIPKGMKDVLPAESARWRAVEKECRQAALLAGYREIRTPVLEHTELFARSAGESSDVVRKEMYTFKDKGDRSVTLKPESTAGTVRAFLESSLYAQALPMKMYYINAPHFRYEAPQSGRLREHHQFGMECFGASQPSADAELIVLVVELLGKLGLENLSVRINSIGCPNCRPAYQQHFKEYLNARREKLCKSCQERMDINPMRTLDCKESACKEELKDAPVMMDHLCDECRAHFEALKGYLEAAGIRYTVDPRIVRGLDYYTKTVFEIITDTPNGELTVCGGGRYDGLISQLGGQATPGMGFGCGLERLIMVMEAVDAPFPEPPKADIYLAPLGDEADRPVQKLVYDLRQLGVSAERDLVGRGLRAQMKHADRIGARFSAVIGDGELESKVLRVKNMETGEQTETELTAEAIAAVVMA